MEIKESDKADQQRKRRKRISRMKSGILIFVGLWMILSCIAIIILSISVVRLNQRIDRLKTYELTETASVTESDTQNGEESSDNADLSIKTENDNIAAENDKHQVYLTFDSGPDENTNAILDVLAEYQVKATFFVSGNDAEEIDAVYKRIVDEGHTLAMHSYSNQYSTIYASQSAFLEDLKHIQSFLKDKTGVESTFYRFPGGSANQISNVDMKNFIEILDENDITYFDWNVESGDLADTYTVAELVENITTGVAKYKTSIVRLNDGEDKKTTVEALGPVIEALNDMKAEILPIDKNTRRIQYASNDHME